MSSRLLTWRYWDLPYDNFNYSYIDVAVDTYGFCTLSIDRLGVGNSSIADPLDVIQAPAETSAIYELTMMLRKATLPSVPHAFTKVVHVGHSFGSALSYNLAASYPGASDGLILTGYSSNGSFFPATVAAWDSKLARLNQPLRFGNISYSAVTEAMSLLGKINLNSSAITGYLAEIGVTIEEIQSVVQSTDLADFIAGAQPTDLPHMQNLPTGYLTWVDSGSNQYAFLYPGYFDPDILFFAESTKFPYSLGEILTIGGSVKVNPFTGPVLVVTGGMY